MHALRCLLDHRSYDVPALDRLSYSNAATRSTIVSIYLIDDDNRV